MYTEEFLRISLAGAGRAGFLISYRSELGRTAEDAADLKETKDKLAKAGKPTYHLDEPWVTRHAPTAEAAAKVITAIMEKAAKDDTKNSPADVFDKVFKQAAKEV